MGTTLLVQNISNRFKYQLETNIFQNVCIKGFSTTDVQRPQQMLKASELISEFYPEEEIEEEDDEEYMDLNHFSAPLAFHTVHRSQPMDMNFKSLPSRRRQYMDEEERKAGIRCRTEWEKRAEHESRLEELNQKLFKSPKKSSCFFLKMFQARCPQLSCATTARTYASMYSRASDHLLASLSRCEKSFITQFKHQHPQLNSEEWAYFQGFIPSEVPEQVLADADFVEFVDLVEKWQDTKGCQAAPASPNCSMLHRMLHNTSPNGNYGDIKKLSVPECLKLYLCVQYPNYEELWDSSKVVLDRTLKQSIETFLDKHFATHSPLFTMFLDMMNVLDQ